MKTAYDRAAMARLLTLDLDADLRFLLERRIASLDTRWGDLSDWTEIAIFEPGDADADIERELGFSLLITPDGARFGEPAFHPFWDHLVRRGLWAELTVTFGSAFAYILYLPDVDGVPDDLRTIVRRYGL